MLIKSFPLEIFMYIDSNDLPFTIKDDFSLKKPKSYLFKNFSTSVVKGVGILGMVFGIFNGEPISAILGVSAYGYANNTLEKRRDKLRQQSFELLELKLMDELEKF
jgi:hypothetical protein